MAARSSPTSRPRASTRASTAGRVMVRPAPATSDLTSSALSASVLTAGISQRWYPASAMASRSLLPRVPPSCRAMRTTSSSGAATYSSASARKASFILCSLEATIALGSPKREGPARVLRVPAPYSSASILVTAVVRSRSRAARTSRATALSPTTGSPTRRRTTGARSSLSQAGPFGLLCRAATGQVSHAHPTGRSHREVTSDPRTTIVPHARVVYRSAGAYIWSIRADGCP